MPELLQSTEPNNAEGDNSATTKKRKKCCSCFFRRRNKSKEPQAMESGFAPQNNATSSNFPFCADLPKDLAGKAIHLPAVCAPSCPRFAVNLTCGKGPSADIAFHFNPRLLQRYIVRNSRLNGQWGQEETTSPRQFPVARGKKFDLVIFVSPDVFVVCLDDAHICTYRHRVPLARVTAIQIEGCVEIVDGGVSCEKIDRGFFPVKSNAIAVSREDVPVETEAMVPFFNAFRDSPVSFLLPGGFQPGQQLEIYGRVKILPHSFYINLQVGAHQWPHPVVPLHLNPRFTTDLGKPLLVRNAWIDGGWGQEERTPSFQFSPGSPFTMAIRRGTDHFSVWIDGKLAGEFKFRGGVDQIDTLYVVGDVAIGKVCWHEK